MLQPQQPTGLVPLQGEAMRKLEENAQNILATNLMDGHKPDNGQVAAPGEAFTIGGKQYTVTELSKILDDHTNNTRWRSENTADAERLAQRERELAQRNEQVNSLVTTLTSTLQQRTAAPGPAAPTVEALPEEALVNPQLMQSYLDKRLSETMNRLTTTLEDRLKAIPGEVSKSLSANNVEQHNKSLEAEFMRANPGLNAAQAEAVFSYTSRNIQPDTNGRWTMDQLLGVSKDLGYTEPQRPRMDAQEALRIRREADAAADVLRGGGAPDATQTVTLEDLIADPSRVRNLPNDVLLKAVAAVRAIQGGD